MEFAYTFLSKEQADAALRTGEAQGFRKGEASGIRKGVEMTMAGLMKALEGLGVTQIYAAGRPFDPNVHNAVMHIEDESFGENTVAEVFQAGFMLGEKVIRFAMVKVAN